MSAVSISAADHLDAPLVKKDHRIDINDVYVFHPNGDLSRTALVMTTNPAAGVISPTTYRPDAVYQFLIDTNGDAVQDAHVDVTFSVVQRGRQFVTVDWSGRGRISGQTGTVFSSNDVHVFAGLRDDPFFFDLNSFNDGATFCQRGDSDFFKGLNTMAIVIDAPTSAFGASKIGIWGRTLVNNRQMDRMGRPAILTVFIPPNPFEASPELENAYNATLPVNDQARWRSEVVDSLQLFFSLNNSSGDNPADDNAKIQGLANFLLPDILTVDLSKATSFPNGRALRDDVTDIELGLITENAIQTDCINNDSVFLSSMPYLGSPN